jgi:hypothetical protein
MEPLLGAKNEEQRRKLRFRFCCFEVRWYASGLPKGIGLLRTLVPETKLLGEKK